MTYDSPHPIGDPFSTDTPPPVFHLDLDVHISLPHPATFNTPDAPYLDPHDYFVTSGDAVAKAQQLEADLWVLAGRIRSYNKQKKQHKRSKYEQAAWKAAGQARTLVRRLIEARGPMCFLETEWRNRILLVIPKNPRNRNKPK